MEAAQEVAAKAESARDQAIVEKKKAAMLISARTIGKARRAVHITFGAGWSSMSTKSFRLSPSDATPHVALKRPKVAGDGAA